MSITLPRRIAIFAVLVVLTLGCGGGDANRTPQDVVGSAPTKAERPEKRFFDPLLHVPGWPFDDGKSQYRLFWNGDQTKLPLFAEPDPNAELLAELSYGNGEEIETSGDYVAVYQPAIFRTKRQMTITGKVHQPGSQSHGRRFSKELDRGDSVAVYLYAGGTDCFVGVGGKIIVTSCPTPQGFVGTFAGPSLAAQMQPLQKIWWVKIATPIATGWVPLDDRVLADILPLAAKGQTSVAAKPPVDGATDTTPEDGEVAAREDALFGDEPPSGEAEPGETTDSGLGAPILTDEEIGDRIEAKDDPLTVGAFAFLRLQYWALEKGDGLDFELPSPSLLDVYLDARPNNRLRVYARGRLQADFTLPRTDEDGERVQTVQADLDQFWMKFDLARVVYFTLGKQRIKWGTGRFWNPTDFLNSVPRDVLDVNTFDSRLGVVLAKVHLPVERLNWNNYLIAQLGEAQTPRNVGAAIRSEFFHQQTEVSVSAAARRGEPWRVGADLSTGIWLFDFHAEGAALYADPRPYYRGQFDLPSSFPQEFKRDDVIIPMVVAGGEMQIPYRRGDVLVVGGEFFYNDTGYPDASWYPWLFTNGRYTSFYAGRRYGGAYAALLGPGSWDDTSFFATALGNFSDESYLARVDVSQRAMDYLQWSVFGNYHFGQTGELRYGLELEPSIFAPDGVSIVRPLFEVGVGLQLEL